MTEAKESSITLPTKTPLQAGADVATGTFGASQMRVPAVEGVGRPGQLPGQLPGAGVVVPAPGILPEQLLQDGEIIILMLKPSLWAVLLESLAFLTWVLILLLLGLTLQQMGWLPLRHTDLSVMVVVAVGGRLLWQFLDWLSRVYVLTDRRVLVVRGVVRVQVFECALKRIQHTTTTFNLRERLFGLGSLSFHTAGVPVTEATWRMLARPLQVHHIVVQTLNRYR